MDNSLLLEIGVEEMPARFIRQAMNQLQERIVHWLTENRISFTNVKVYATPRRLAILVQHVASKQTDIQEEVKGPAKKIALDADGEWTKAAYGFVRSQGIELTQCFFRQFNDTEYMYVRKRKAGLHTIQMLEDGLTAIIGALHFPKNMRWGTESLRFIRPIRWLVALYGQQVIPLEIAGVKAGRISQGHRFLGVETIIHDPLQYIEYLRAQFVIVDVEERQAMIMQQLKELGMTKEWEIIIPPDLLEEVLFLVEYPTVLHGTFSPSFLHIPQAVLIMFMREHQRYFPVLNKERTLLPYFVAVRNGDKKGLHIVTQGNEKVLSARLADANFFYEQDQKLTIDDCVRKLDTIVFHEQLGTIGDKVRRIQAIADALTTVLQTDRQTTLLVNRTTTICKFDLVTQMVYEFPELQGIMGEHYARQAGESSAVACAIREHYKPSFAGDTLPTTLIGTVLSIADKIDTCVGCFSIGITPTGSQDPYGLRRQATGIMQILIAGKCSFSLSTLFELTLDVYERANLMKRNREEIRKQLYEFCELRIKHILSEMVSYDISDAVMSAGYDDVKEVVARAEALMQVIDDPLFQQTVEAFNRVNKLAIQAEHHQVNSSLFTEEAEHNLYHHWVQVHANYEAYFHTPKKALAILAQLKDEVYSFFSQVMVMTHDEVVRNNRLALLANLAQDIHRFADFSKLVAKL